MNLFLLIAQKIDGGDRFLAAVTPLVSQDKLEVFRDFSGFADRLRRPKDPFSTLLVLAPSHEDLRRVVSLRDYLKDSRILFVLADQDWETVSLAHRALPTYITYLDNGTSGVVSVLKQLLRVARGKDGQT